MPSKPDWNEGRAREIIGGLSALEGATLPILHALQDEFGFVDARATPLIAEALNLSRAEVHGAIHRLAQPVGNRPPHTTEGNHL